MSIIKYYFIVIIVAATALTLWDKLGRKKKGDDKGDAAPKDEAPNGEKKN